MSIQAIDHSSVHRLTSGQVVIDLQTAVKELLENALDAGATSVVIHFREHGVESIEVQDNGRGISEDNWAGIALKHHTSKLSSFADLDSVATLGFRGEALSSLCGTATLSVITATAETAPAGTNLSFKPSGECVVGGKAARSKGTTVLVKELFKTLPVRRKELIKNAKREFGKAVDLIQSYALIKTGCRFEVKNVVKGKSSTHLQTPPATSVRSNFSSIFSPKSLVTMMDLDLDLDVVADKSVLKWSEDRSGRSTQVLVKGLVSKPTTGSGRTSGNRQFFYVNGRPFAPAKIAKAFNEVYKTYNIGHFPAVVADFQLPPDAYDVNVSPDKRTIFLHSEGNLVTALKAALEELFQPSRSTFAMDSIGPTPAKSSTSALKRSSVDTPIACRGSTSSSPRASSQAETASTPLPSDDEDEAIRPVKRKRSSKPTSDSREVEPETDRLLEETPSRAPPFPVPLEVNGDLETDIIADSQDPPPSPTARKPSPPPATGAADRAPSPSCRSPSPAAAPPQILRQITLDTTEAPWARKSSAAAPKSSSAAPRQSFKSSIRQYLNPTQPRIGVEEIAGAEDDGEADMLDSEPSVMDVDEPEEATIETNEEEEMDKQSSIGETTPSTDEQLPPAQLDSDDDLEIIELSYRPSTVKAEEREEEVQIVAGSCSCPDGARHEHKERSKSIEVDDDTLDQERLEHLASLDDSPADTSLPLPVPSPPQSEIWGTQLAVDTSVNLDFEAITADWAPRASLAPARQSSADAEHAALVGAGIHEAAEAAEATLSRVVTKNDFESMKVIGQFNHAFIIARRKVTASAADGAQDDSELQDDLFIVDQHASDEKYNFERLQLDTVIQSQRLIQPRSLNLPSHDEITAMEHLDLLRLNGFEVLVDEDAEVGERVKLIAQPISKDTVFGVEDFEELLDLIKSSASGETVRPSKARKMFASRACRKSVMFGKPLTSTQMTTILRHMGGMDQPWSCPHGRPTLRWLAGLAQIASEDKRANVASVLALYAPEQT